MGDLAERDAGIIAVKNLTLLTQPGHEPVISIGLTVTVLRLLCFHQPSRAVTLADLSQADDAARK